MDLGYHFQAHRKQQPRAGSLVVLGGSMSKKSGAPVVPIQSVPPTTENGGHDQGLAYSMRYGTSYPGDDAAREIALMREFLAKLQGAIEAEGYTIMVGIDGGFVELVRRDDAE